MVTTDFHNKVNKFDLCVGRHDVMSTFRSTADGGSRPMVSSAPWGRHFIIIPTTQVKKNIVKAIKYVILDRHDCR